MHSQRCEVVFEIFYLDFKKFVGNEGAIIGLDWDRVVVIQILRHAKNKLRHLLVASVFWALSSSIMGQLP